MVADGEEEQSPISECYAARLSVTADLPELLELLGLPLPTLHPMASTVGEPYPDAPVLYASQGRSESTPIHFDEEENCTHGSALHFTCRTVCWKIASLPLCLVCRILVLFIFDIDTT